MTPILHILISSCVPLHGTGTMVHMYRTVLEYSSTYVMYRTHVYQWYHGGRGRVSQYVTTTGGHTYLPVGRAYQCAVVDPRVPCTVSYNICYQSLYYACTCVPVLECGKDTRAAHNRWPRQVYHT